MKYTITAEVEADSLNEAWAMISALPLDLSSDDLEYAEDMGVRLLCIEGGNRENMKIDWREK